MKDALKPCPFCGGKSDWDSRPGATGEQFWCMCVNDACYFYAVEPYHTRATKPEAIATWNHRASPTKADVERVARVIYELEHGKVSDEEWLARVRRSAPWPHVRKSLSFARVAIAAMRDNHE